MKIAWLCFLFLILGGCSSASLGEKSASQNLNKCEEKPTVTLNTKDVKMVAIGSQLLKESAMLRAGQSIGFSFDGKAGQELLYKTSEGICVWVYSPDNQLLSNPKLAQTGKHTIQVSRLNGSGTFDIEMGLDVINAAVNSPTPTPVAVSSIPPAPVSPAAVISSYSPPRQAPDEFVRNHYTELNRRNYDYTWRNLTPDFQQKATGFSNYLDWWNSVREVQIGRIYVIEQNQNSAIVDAELQYTKNDGDIFVDPNSRIYLVWNSQSNSWLLDNKSKP